MTPFQLAQEHRRLWHVTAAEAVDGILERGLLTAADILDLWQVETEERERLVTRRRARPVLLSHPIHGSVVMNDNVPLNEKKRADALDDGLTTSDWMVAARRSITDISRFLRAVHEGVPA